VINVTYGNARKRESERDKVSMYFSRSLYGVATVSRIDKIMGLFYKRALYKRRYSAKETYDLIDPTNSSHPIAPGKAHWDLSHVIHIWMRCVSHVTEACHMNESCHTHSREHS